MTGMNVNDYRKPGAGLDDWNECIWKMTGRIR